MPRDYKRPRFGRALYEASARPGFFNQTHVIFGGTGAVGGSTALRLMDFFDEAIQTRKPENVNLNIVVTGLTRNEIRHFTKRLFHVHQRTHGSKPEQIKGYGCTTVNGINVRMDNFSVDPAIEEVKMAPKIGLKAAAAQFMERVGLENDATIEARHDALLKAIRDIETGPFTGFLKMLREQDENIHSEDQFTSVTVGIPLPSVATYHSGKLTDFARELGVKDDSALRDLKLAYLGEFPEDLGFVAQNLAEEVLVAHTTGVGGMYDEDEEGNRTIRLGFAHSASGKKLLQKQEFASEMTRQYSQRNIKMLVTAAAIGIDEIIQGDAPPLKADLSKRLQNAIDSGFELVAQEDMTRKRMHVYEPVTIDMHKPTNEPISLGKGEALNCDYVIRSGENGYFSVANADALYRVMGVSSDSELGFVLARTALLGDYPRYPRFVDNVCYYHETDYSRQVFDLLGQPALRDDQLSGLQPKALQDLGSSKHQCELHMLGLLILLYRLQTLTLLDIRSHVDLDRFDAADYFERHSEILMLEDILHWDPHTLAKDLRTLVTARTRSDLSSLQRMSPRFPNRLEAFDQIIKKVLNAVWSIPSLGTPVLFEEDGREKMLCGYYAAPIDKVITNKNSVISYLHEEFKKKNRPGDAAELRRFIEFHIANNGVLDLRPQATLVTCKSPYEDLEGKVQVFNSEAEFVEALQKIEPYTYFTSSGLIALLVRLKGLARHAADLDISIGTSNDFRSHFLNTQAGLSPLLPGVVEAFRMISEGLEKNTGSERISGPWGYGWPAPETK